MTGQPRRILPNIVDTRTIPHQPDRDITAWLGRDLIRWDDTLTVRTADGDAHPQPGWVLCRWPDGGLTVFSPDAARRLLDEAAETDTTPATHSCGQEPHTWDCVTAAKPAATEPERCCVCGSAVVLREVLAAFRSVTDDSTRTLVGYVSAPIHPDDMDRWRAVLDSKEQH